MHGKAHVLNIEDSRVWKVGKDSGFSVKSAYAKLRGPYEEIFCLSPSGRLMLCLQPSLPLGGC